MLSEEDAGDVAMLKESISLLPRADVLGLATHIRWVGKSICSCPFPMLERMLQPTRTREVTFLNLDSRIQG